VLARLRDAGVNLAAFHAFPSARKSQLDFVPSTPRDSSPQLRTRDQALDAKHVFLSKRRPPRRDRGSWSGSQGEINVTAVDRRLSGMGATAPCCGEIEDRQRRPRARRGLRVSPRRVRPRARRRAEALAHFIEDAASTRVALDSRRPSRHIEQESCPATVGTHECDSATPRSRRTAGRAAAGATAPAPARRSPARAHRFGRRPPAWRV